MNRPMNSSRLSQWNNGGSEPGYSGYCLHLKLGRFGFIRRRKFDPFPRQAIIGPCSGKVTEMLSLFPVIKRCCRSLPRMEF
jgi:hypothetical protein